MKIARVFAAAVAASVLSVSIVLAGHYGTAIVTPGCDQTTIAFHLDSGHTVGWQIRSDGQVVTQGSANAPGGNLTKAFDLPPGSYELRWDNEPVDASYQSQRFTVECQEGTPTPTPTTTPTPWPTTTPTTTPRVTPTPPNTPTSTPLTCGLPEGCHRTTLPPTDTVSATAPARPDRRVLAAILVLLGSILIASSVISIAVARRKP